jgi:hypothetical protein
MTRNALAATLALVTMGALARAQDDLAGYHQYPQFRVLSGLPGGGFGVLPNGQPGIRGAAALATPIGYTMGRAHGALGVFNTGSDLNPFSFDFASNETRAQTNGTLQAMIAGSYQGFRGTASYMVLSSVGDSVFNLQVSPTIKGRVGVAVGVQDLVGGGGASGTNFAGDGDSSSSLFAVGTYDLGRDAYVSLGTGTRRYEGIFGNASALVAPRLRAVAEYDTFNWNAGLIYNTGNWRSIGDKSASVEGNIFLGLVRGKYGTVGFTLTF